jgi:hypothetical protein
VADVLPDGGATESAAAGSRPPTLGMASFGAKAHGTGTIGASAASRIR